MDKNIEISAIFRISNETGNAYMKRTGNTREKENIKRIDKQRYLLKFKNISLYLRNSKNRVIES